MRNALKSALALLIAVGTFTSLTSDASANPIASGGYSSSYAGESAFTAVAAGQSGQMSAIFFNDGTQPWTPGVVGLLVCAADKVTCNVPSNPSYNLGWFSQTVYATVTTTVGPGQNGFFVYSFQVPQNTANGTVTTFYGDVGLIATGDMLRPEGYFQSNTVPTPAVTLTVTPSPASVQVGQTQQFTVSGAPVGATVTWAVNGGCGAITTAGLFAATSMNSSSQPCTVVATAAGGQGIAVVMVFGQPTQLSCAATPNPIVANGGLTGGQSTATISVRDANGNVVANASQPTINIANNTPTLATMIPSGPVGPINGVVTVSIKTTNVPGDIQLSASGAGVVGCNVIVTSAGPGNASKTLATFLTNPIGADGISTSTLQVDVTDANGTTVGSDNVTQIEASRNLGAGVCTITGVTQGTLISLGDADTVATVSQGRVRLTVKSTSQPGTCAFVILTNNAAIAGTSASLTTQIIGLPNQLAVLSNDSPHQVSSTGTCTVGGTNTDISCTTIVVGVRDGNGNLVTSESGRSFTVSFDSATCSGAGGGSPVLRASSVESGGKATFVFSSAGAYSNCAITFTSSGVAGVSTAVAWNPGSANHLACTFAPNPIAADGASESAGLVTVRDTFNNNVNAGSYQVSFTRIAGPGVTVQRTSSPQTMIAGSVVFYVRSTTNAGSDTYRADTFVPNALPGNSTSCAIQVQ